MILPASGPCPRRGPEVSFWSITLLAKSFCGTCPRSRFLDNFKVAKNEATEAEYAKLQ